MWKIGSFRFRTPQAQPALIPSMILLSSTGRNVLRSSGAWACFADKMIVVLADDGLLGAAMW